MSKDQKKTINLPVETVENLCESLEWMISSINFWKMDNEYPCNLILRVASDFLYIFRKSLYNDQKTEKIKKNK